MSWRSSSRACGWTVALATAALAATPLAAQTTDDAETQTGAEASAAPADEPASQPFELEVVGGDEQSLASHPVGTALPQAARVCLDRDQHLIVSVNGEAIDYSGPGCFEPRADLAIPIEAYAGSHVWYPLAEDSPGWTTGTGCAAVVVDSSGPSADAFARGARISVDGKIVLQAGDRVSLLTSRGSRTLVGPGTFDTSCDAAAGVASAFPARRARFGAVRGFPEPPADSPAAQRLIATRGTAGALKKFPRGTVIASPLKVCLAAGDRLTVAGRSGARMTFAGPGCGHRLGAADDDNTPAVSPG